MLRQHEGRNEAGGCRILRVMDGSNLCSQREGALCLTWKERRAPLAPATNDHQPTAIWTTRLFVFFCSPSSSSSRCIAATFSHRPWRVTHHMPAIIGRDSSRQHWRHDINCVSPGFKRRPASIIPDARRSATAARPLPAWPLGSNLAVPGCRGRAAQQRNSQRRHPSAPHSACG